ILSRSFIKLTAEFPKRPTGPYIALRSRHAPLNHHLHRIGKVPSSRCPHCPDTDETILHLLIACPHYRHARHALTNSLGRGASSLPFLLSDPSATPHLAKFLNATSRFKKTFGEV
ncbi:hypothetical protein CY34DRAFT_35921, partial [Suillus luteus UH-Slu-Lm8-n1]